MNAPTRVTGFLMGVLAVFSIDGSDPHLMPDLAAAIDMAEDSR